MKIPKYSNTIRRVSPEGGYARGFSGSEIQYASQSGLETAGKGIGNIAEMLAAKEEDRLKKDGNLWSEDTSLKLKKDMLEWSRQYNINDETPDGQGASDNYLSEFDKRSEAYLQSAPTKFAADALQNKLPAIRNNVFKNGVEYEATQRVTHQKDQLNSIAESKAVLVFEDPLTLGQEITSLIDMIDALEDDPKTKQIEGYKNLFSATARKQLKKSQINSIIKNSANAIMLENNSGKISILQSELESGKYDKYLGLEDKTTLLKKLKGLNTIEKAAAKRELKDKMNQNYFSIQETGEVTHNLDMNQMIDLIGADNALEYAEKIEYNKKIYSVKMDFIHNPGERQKILDSLEKPNMTFKDQQYKKDVQTVYKSVIQAVEDLPIEFAKKYRPDIFAKISATDSLDADSSDDEIDAANMTLQRGLRDLIQMQKNFGIRDNEIQLIDTHTAKSIVSLLSDTSTQKEAVQIQVSELQRKYGPYFSELVGDLVNMGELPEDQAAAYMYIDNPLLFAETIGKLKLYSSTMKTEDVPGSVTQSIVEEVASNNTWQEFSKAVAQHNPEAIGYLANLQQMIGKLTHLHMLQTGARDAKPGDVINNYIGETQFLITEDFVIPTESANLVGMDHDDFEEVAADIKDLVVKHKIEIREPSSVSGIEKMLPSIKDAYVLDYEGGLAWRNTSDGSGIELIWNLNQGEIVGTYPVERFIEGQADPIPMKFTWEQLKEVYSSGTVK